MTHKEVTGQCVFCSNRSFFWYSLPDSNKDVETCPVCYLEKFKERLGKFSDSLRKLVNNLAKNPEDRRTVVLYMPESTKVLWTGYIPEHAKNLRIFLK